MRYQIHTGSRSVHDVLIALGVEDAAHSTGAKCMKVASDGENLDLDAATVFEAGTPAGQFSAATLEAAQAGLIDSNADMTTLKSFLGAASPTLAQNSTALKALIRVVRRMAQS